MNAASSDRATILAGALAGAHEALRFAGREIDAAAAGDPGRWPWAAVGLAAALQGALIAALSGYETASPDAIAVPGEPGRVAPLALLLRRARSADYLNAPERIDLPASQIRRIDRLAGLRNAAVHCIAAPASVDPAGDAAVVAGLIAHLLLDHPAFDPAPHGVVRALIGDDLRAIRRTLDAPA